MSLNTSNQFINLQMKEIQKILTCIDLQNATDQFATHPSSLVLG